jgi:uncharacterized membrane protein YccC
MRTRHLLPLLLLAACAQQPLPPPSLPTELAPPANSAVVINTLPDEVAPLLAYHQTLRRMTQGELMKELGNLAALPKSARVQLQTALALMQTKVANDLVRAQSLLEGVASDAESPPLRQLAQLLSSQCAETRRLNEHADRLQSQLKESQRKNDQLNDMLEALKAIERGLPSRPAGASAAPGAK